MGRYLHGRKAVSTHPAVRTLLIVLPLMAFSFARADPDEKRAPTTHELDAVVYRPLDIAGSGHPLVEQFRKKYRTPFGEKSLATTLANGERYRLYIREQLTKRNMPAVLEYLPVVESEYRTAARSRSGALGLWQFMENSMAPFLKKSEFIDERLDPWKSTDAALSKLQDYYSQFQDWALAITAYNCGAGALARTLARSPEKNFWYLAEHKLLRTETMQYVPKLLAIADLATNSVYYGLSLPDIQPEVAAELSKITNSFDYVTVHGSYSLRWLAAELRIDEDTVLELNAALVRGITPPDAVYAIRLPAGLKASAHDALATAPFRAFTRRYVVKRGDTLYAIAQAAQTTVQALCTANGISEKTPLTVGKVLYLPEK